MKWVKTMKQQMNTIKRMNRVFKGDSHNVI